MSNKKEIFTHDDGWDGDVFVRENDGTLQLYVEESDGHNATAVMLKDDALKMAKSIINYYKEKEKATG